MYCPQCQDEFREGFTRCADCDVELVASLDAIPEPGPTAAVPQSDAGESAGAPPILIRMVDYCGFLTLEDAREARGQLRVEGIRCEIVIREEPGLSPSQPVEEEFWMRVEESGYRRASALLGFDESPDEDDGNEDPFRL